MSNKSKVKVNITPNKTASTNKSGAVNGKVVVRPKMSSGNGGVLTRQVYEQRQREINAKAELKIKK